MTLEVIQMKKYFKYFVFILILIAFCKPDTGKVFADSYNDNTLIYTQYNSYANYYDDLSGISVFDINDKYIVYCSNSTQVTILNRITKQSTELSHNQEFNNITYIKITQHYLFVADNGILRAFRLGTLQEASIVDADNSAIGIYRGYSVCETTDNIIIACITDNSFVAYFYSISNLKYSKTYTNSSNDLNQYTMLNVATTDRTAYIINSATNSDGCSLWILDYNNSTTISSALFPKPNIINLSVYTYNTFDYLLAVDNKNNVYVLRSDLHYSTIESDFNADQTLSGNSSDKSFLLGDRKTPEDIKVYNNYVYLSDSGTKCIQKMKFDLNSDDLAQISATEIIIASECGGKGWYNTDSNLSFSEYGLVVSSFGSKKVQLVAKNDVIMLDRTSGITDFVCDLAWANNGKIYCVRNNQPSTKIYIFDIHTQELINTINGIGINFVDICNSSSKAYLLSTDGIYSVDCTTDTITAVRNTTFDTSDKIDIINNKIIVSTMNKFITYDISSYASADYILSNSVTDFAVKDNSLFVLDNSAHQLVSCKLEDGNTTTVSSISLEEIDYSSIAIDNNTGVIYLFNNEDCKIEKLINPTFNFAPKTGIFQANNRKVSIYDRPYFLNGIDTPNVIATLGVNQRVNIYSTEVISYGNINYYVISYNNGYGYINVNDLTYLYEVINHEIILPNATIRNFGNEDSIDILLTAEEGSPVIATAPIGTRVLAEKKTDDSNYVFVKYYTQDQQLVEGYVLVSSLAYDDLDNSQIIALILIAACLILLVFILITIKIVKVHNRKKQTGKN